MSSLVFEFKSPRHSHPRLVAHLLLTSPPSTQKYYTRHDETNQKGATEMHAHMKNGVCEDRCIHMHKCRYKHDTNITTVVCNLVDIYYV